MIPYYDWPNYRLLVSFTTYGNSSVYAALKEEGVTMSEFLELVSEKFERPPSQINPILIGPEEWELLYPYYSERDMVLE